MKPARESTNAQEHARADEITAAERAERDLIVASLLDSERRHTDAGLLLERLTADEVLSQREHFLGMVSHDLRNELASIAMNAPQMVKNASHDEAGGKIFRSATNVQRIALRMSRLIGDLLDVASIEAGKFTIMPEDHEVGRVVEDAIESFQPIASAKGISLVGERAAEVTQTRLDPGPRRGSPSRIPAPVSRLTVWRRSSSVMSRGGMPTEKGWASVSTSRGGS